MSQDSQDIRTEDRPAAEEPTIGAHATQPSSEHIDRLRQGNERLQ